MEVSNDTKKILEFLDYTSGKTLRKRNDLGTILEILAKNNQPDIANQIIFYGSGLWNSSSLLKKNKMLNSKRLEDETNNLFNALKELIRYTIELSSEAMIRKRFKEVYLNENLGCKLNLLDLAYDLNELKKVQLVFQRS